MKIIVEDLARQSIDNIFYYNMKYSLKNAIDIDKDIGFYIDNLANFPYIGRYIPEMSNKRFREIIYKNTRNSGYRIIYYISEKSNTIYVICIINNKQDFRNILKLHNYFKNYYNF